MIRRGSAWLALAALSVLSALSGCSTISGWLGDEKPKAAEAKAAATAEANARKIANYELTVDAPTDSRALLIEHLDLARFQRTPESERLSAVELDRLAATTPAQARLLLETEGFFNSEVVLSREPNEGTGSPERVKVQVKTGPQTQVETVDFTFAGELGVETPDKQTRELQDGLRRAWTMPVGEAFSQPAWSSAKTAMLVRARMNGYPLARWEDTAAQVVVATNKAVLTLKLDSGPLFHLGALNIEGLKYQSEDTVRRLASFKPGDAYSEKTLIEFQERLQKTLLFDSVNVELQVESDQAQSAPVRVVLREAPRQQATMAVGYSANTGQRVTVEHIHRIPFGLPIRSKEKLDLGRDLQSASVELSSHPQSNLSRNLGSVEIERDLSGNQITTNLSARIGRLVEQTNDERLIYAELLRAREQQLGSSINTGAASLNVQWIRRRLDSALLPTNGTQALLLVGGGRADSSVADSGMFGKLQFKLGWYKPLGDNWYGNARVELGQVLASDRVGIPDKLLFRAGGDESVRGYAYHGLGPVANGLDVGGRVLGVGSIELARPLARSLPAFWGAVFVDAGNAAADWQSYKPAIGYGVGLRWRSPVGPLRVDFARGVDVHRWRLHFSVGIAL